VESTGIDSSCKEVESSWHSIRNSIPLDSTGILTFSLPNLLKYSTGFHWIQVESAGIQLELVGDMKDLGEGDVGGVEPRGGRSSGAGGLNSFPLPLTFDDMLGDDHAHLRWSHTSRTTRIKKIWSMTDSTCCLDLGGSVWGAGASDGDE